MRHLRRLVLALMVVAIAAAAIVPPALGVTAKPSLSLRAGHTTVAVGKRVTLSGLVRHAVAGDRTVRLWLVVGTKATLKQTGTISRTGAYRFSARAAKAGPVVLRVTYTAHGTVFRSNRVRITIVK
ncbi:MAG TPA: hypothetical protein VMU14_16410 [Acidimicrobiales bacterium]|nr:hypothetical protein [Acidimicrobiales bacterium]